MSYVPLNYSEINVAAGTYNPSQVKSFNNQTFDFWERSLFQRACSVLTFDLPEAWQGPVRDFLFYCLFKFGYVAVFDNPKFGLSFQPCTLSGYNFYYQPTNLLISNPVYNADLEIGKDCEILKLTPDYFGTWDIISYYAEKLSTLDNAINMSLINNKFAFLIGAKNKTAAEALKKMMDKINRGEPAVIWDKNILNNPKDNSDPWQFLERKNLKESYLTTQQLEDFNTLIRCFDAEVGIPTLDDKKERLVTSEAEAKTIDASSRSVVWYDTLSSSIDIINAHYPELNLGVHLRYQEQEASPEEEVNDNE